MNEWIMKGQIDMCIPCCVDNEGNKLIKELALSTKVKRDHHVLIKEVLHYL